MKCEVSVSEALPDCSGTFGNIVPHALNNGDAIYGSGPFKPYKNGGVMLPKDVKDAIDTETAKYYDSISFKLSNDVSTYKSGARVTPLSRKCKYLIKYQ